MTQAIEIPIVTQDTDEYNEDEGSPNPELVSLALGMAQKWLDERAELNAQLADPLKENDAEAQNV